MDFTDEERMVLLNSSLKKLQEEINHLRYGASYFGHSNELTDDIFRQFRQFVWPMAIKTVQEYAESLDKCKKLLSRCYGYLKPNVDSIAYEIALMWHECFINQCEAKMNYVNEIIRRMEAFDNGEGDLEQRKYNFIKTIQEQSDKIHEGFEIDFPSFY